MAVTIDQVLTEWKEDCKIDESKVNKELIKTPNLHAKYLDYYTYFKVKLAAAEKKYNILAWKKRRYFRGEMDKAELATNNWTQWTGLKPSSAELNQLLDMDSDMNDLGEVVAGYKTAVASCEFIMKSVGSRDWLLKSLIEYTKYLSGS
jgi:hypothetical protein